MRGGVWGDGAGDRDPTIAALFLGILQVEGANNGP